MTTPADRVHELASALSAELAGASLTPSLARLYSQHTRLRARRDGLPSWRGDEAHQHLTDAERLLGAGLILRDANDDQWRQPIVRAAEILEWLSHPQIETDRVLLPFLAAASYQVAGYPARALSLLPSNGALRGFSACLRAFLSADFRALTNAVAREWAARPPRSPDLVNFRNPDDSGVPQWLVQETVSAFGVIAAEMRWGDTGRLDKAVAKLHASAKAYLHADDPYVWLLAKLVAEVASAYAATSMRNAAARLITTLDLNGRHAMERYVRQAYSAGRSLVWPSQSKGIEQLMQAGSFALCTPTGSGKTTVAELAILQSLFLRDDDPGVRRELLTANGIGPLAVYLVPSRALAAEVEARLSRTFRHLSQDEVVVTGLYGGTDWGPTDAWLAVSDRTVLICTYEKAEALLRFFGPLLLQRLELAIIDEAHTVQFDGSVSSLTDGGNRPLHLEWLTSRLLDHLAGSDSAPRIIALSAVAGAAETLLARWVTGDTNAVPTTTGYRSTRQLIGRIACQPNRHTVVRYDLLDGSSLQIGSDQQSHPYVPDLFPMCPPAPSLDRATYDKRIRAFALWAAMHLAAPDADGQVRSVLVSITQHIGGYAEDFLKLLSSDWHAVQLPSFFEGPTDDRQRSLWERCKLACEDYFGPGSREYRLLNRGIVIHHGKMPGQLARLLVQVIEARIVRLVVATSTLSEGVNLPFETVVIPNLWRGQTALTAREFRNLSGRAGRPGFTPEGRTLVLVEEPTREFRGSQALDIYQGLVRQISQAQLAASGLVAESPLARLLNLIWQAWQQVSGSSSIAAFWDWLERTAPADPNTRENGAVLNLDSLDGLLLSAIVEVERVRGDTLTRSDLEERLHGVWRRTFAAYATINNGLYEQMLVRRGTALHDRIYPDAGNRRRLYATSLPPRSAQKLITSYQTVRNLLNQGATYAAYSPAQRFDFIKSIVEQLATVDRFAMGRVGSSSRFTWDMVLQWWLDRQHATVTPSPTQVSVWYDFVSEYFGYKFSWGIGGIIALAIDETFGSELSLPSLERWTETGLPWIAFWLKELMIWGTLEPTAAHLLAHGVVTTRSDAERLAQDYYTSDVAISADDPLDASAIRDWASTLQPEFDIIQRAESTVRLNVSVRRDFSRVPHRLWRVIPARGDRGISWIDPSGSELAFSSADASLTDAVVDSYDFLLDPVNAAVVMQPYY